MYNLNCTKTVTKAPILTCYIFIIIASLAYFYPAVLFSFHIIRTVIYLYILVVDLLSSVILVSWQVDIIISHELSPHLGTDY